MPLPRGWVSDERLLVTYVILPMKWEDFRMAPYSKLFSLVWLVHLQQLQLIAGRFESAFYFPPNAEVV